jgi:hypothetical protein
MFTRRVIKQRVVEDFRFMHCSNGDSRIVHVTHEAKGIHGSAKPTKGGLSRLFILLELVLYTDAF